MLDCERAAAAVRLLVGENTVVHGASGPVSAQLGCGNATGRAAAGRRSELESSRVRSSSSELARNLRKNDGREIVRTRFGTEDI